MLFRSPKLNVAFFAQHQLDDLIPAQSAVEHVRARLPHLGESQIRGTVDRFGLPTNRMDTPAKDLSGGEKARLLMGLATLGGANLMILDEPTNHLDVDSRAALVDAVNGFEGAVILISHDRHLVESTADRLWIVADGGVRSYDGDLEDYRRLVLGNTRENRGGRDGENSQARRKASADRRGQLAPLKKQISEAEKKVEKLQAAIARLDAAMADAAAFTADPQRGTRLAKERADAVRSLARAEEEWLELSSSYEQAMAAE